MSSNDINIGALSEALNNKADLNLLNLSGAGKARVANLAAPSSKYLNLTLNASGSSYTAPADGWFMLRRLSDTGQYTQIVDTKTNMMSLQVATNSNQVLSVNLPVKKGGTVTVSYNAVGNVQFFRFIYAEGSEPSA